MKLKVFTLLLTLLAASAFAQDSEDPAQFCHETGLCTSRMQEITSLYSSGKPTLPAQGLMAYSGSCYHISHLYDSERQHFGAFVFERTGSDLMTSGVFSFFSEEDPYGNMTPIEIKAWLRRSGFPFFKTAQTESSLVLKVDDPEAKFRYWFRSSADFKSLAVIGLQASSDYLALVFCELKQR